jgi:hypothetical protein
MSMYSLTINQTARTREPSFNRCDSSCMRKYAPCHEPHRNLSVSKKSQHEAEHEEIHKKVLANRCCHHSKLTKHVGHVAPFETENIHRLSRDESTSSANFQSL